MQYFNIILVMCCLLIIKYDAHTQTLDEAHKYFVGRNYSKAYPLYQEALKKDSTTKKDVLFYSALCLYGTYYFENAKLLLAQLEKIITKEEKKNIYPVDFYLGQCFMQQKQYHLANVSFNKFLKSSFVHQDFTQTARSNIKNCEFAINYTPKSNSNIDSLQKIIFPDFEQFSKADFGNAHFNSRDSILFFTLAQITGNGLPEIDIYSSKLNRNKQFETPVKLPEPINSNLREKEFCLDNTGDVLILSRHLVDVSNINTCEIKAFKKTGTQWNEIKDLPLSIQKSSYCDTYPFICQDGNAIYFSSDRPGGQGGYDIWVIEKINEKWTLPKNLGPTVNTPGDEFDPFLNNKGNKLYFSSTEHEGFGGADVFLCQKQEYGWSKPENMGNIINSPQDDFDFSFSPTKQTGFITRLELPSFSPPKLDTPAKERIYIFKFPNILTD